MIKISLDSVRASCPSITPTISSPVEPPVSSFNPVIDFSTIERNRSVVVAGLPESKVGHASSRVLEDYNHLRAMMDHLSIDCSCIAVYRLGRPSPDRSRLVKVILPSSYFARTMINRAPLLKSFHIKGVYIRASLTKEERDKRKAERAANRACVPSCPVTSDGMYFSSPYPSQIIDSNTSLNPICSVTCNGSSNM